MYAGQRKVFRHGTLPYQFKISIDRASDLAPLHLMHAPNIRDNLSHIIEKVSWVMK
jgi:hypothetical protein